MLKQIIHFSIRNKLIIGLLTLGLVVWGAYQATQLPIDAVPDITDNQVQVITVSPSLGAPDIERLITFPIEQVNSNIPGLKEIRSFSRFGLSVVTIVFNDAVDVYWARQQVAERLQQVQSQIPTQFGKPELAPVTTGLGEIYQYVVRPKAGFEGKYDVMQLRTIQDWIVRRQLLGTQGVAEVASFGGKLKQYEIALNPYKLKSYNLTVDDVFTALAKNNQNTGGAYIEKGPTVLFIRSEGLVANEEDLNNIVVSSTASNIPVLIRDVGAVHLGNATRYGAMTFNDKGEVAGAVVMMLKGENSSAVIRRVKEKIAQVQKSLPEGVVIEPFLDRTKMVNNAISTVERNLTEGALIVIFVLVLFLGNLRAGLVVASVIPLAMLFAIIMMNAFGVSGNLMSLGAIDFGLIVDGAVIIVEAVMHQLKHSKHFSGVNRLTQEKMDDEVEHSASRMMNASIFGQIIILIVYLPIFSLQGIEGKMFKPMAQTVTFALLGAFILSLTYVPMMTSLAISKKISHKPNLSDRVMNRLERIYQHALAKSLRLSKVFIASAVALFIISVFILSRMGGEFIPKLEEGDFAVETRVLTGSNITTSVNTLLKASQILKARFPEVEKVVGKNGSSEIPTDPMPIEASDLMIILKDKSTWTSAKTFDELSEKMQAALQEIPGVTFGFQYPVQMRFNELISGARQDVVCKIFGEDLDSLASYANKLGAVVSTVDGAADLYIETVTGMPQIIIRYNRRAIAQYGLTIEDINRVINTGFAGQSTGQVYEGEKRFDLVVRLESGQRQNIADVQNLLIATPSGTQIPLSQVADVRITEGPNQIQREDAKRRIIVGFNVRGRDVKSVVNELQGKVEQQMKLPAGYFVTYGGAFENLQEAQKRLSIAVPVSLLLIFLLLYFAFRSVKQGLLIYSAIPLSAIGGVLALAIRGMPFSISAGVGFIALFGVAVLNGIVLISEFNRLRKEGWKDVKRIVLQGTKVRLRPVLMTAMVASLGFIPMALSSGAGAEVQRPLATVVIGGLVTATFLTLFILPMLYVIFDGKKKIKSLPVKAAAMGLLFVVSGMASLKAQTPVTLQQALDTAVQNNLAVRSSQLNVAYYQQLQGSARDVSKTAFNAEVGQFNSYQADTRLGVQQTINFPTVYTRQKALYQAQTRRSQTELQWTKLQLKEQVRQDYSDIVALKQKQKLLQFADSIYARFLSKAALRYKAGETSIVERAAAENQRKQISLQLQTMEADINTALISFNTLLNSRHYFVPADTGLRTQPAFIADTALLSLHPAIQLKQNDVLIAEQNWQLQKAKLLPDLTLGYSNQSIIGNQLVNGVNKYYDAGNRFHSVQAGIAISLFSGAQKSRIRAAQTAILQSQTEYELAGQRTLSAYRTLIEQYRVQQANVQAYETTMLKNASTVLNAANLQFQNGEINYLEWVMLTNQAVSIQSGYIDAVQNLNRIQIQLQTLTGNQ
ncbi:MAG: CusA/CzcA family heavy metal efflux RND transporter [Sediminibacterium magnilacihabitans]|jgi:cobalt-zinc-cadmium resistance protein CzcA|nr:CusA/CzcA family heavy metal efflux RND transporter [Sediminibacterium magnilacihabitans]PQV61595.1 cobalt-zinc-cadmium resistance protein CzcA [Sediminibacterium magnilacihabitans]